MKKKSSLLWFCFGIGSQLQIIASLSFTEVFVFMTAPVLFFMELPYLKRNGMIPILCLSLAVVGGCVIACIANQTPQNAVLRGMAVTTLLPCTVVVGHWMLRRDMYGFRWMLVGGAISNIISTFIFQKSVEVTMLAGGDSGLEAAQDIIAGPVYWISRLGGVVTLLPTGWYMQCPLIFAIVAPLSMAGFSILTTVSGRAAALGAFAAAVILALGGKRPSIIRKNICQKFWVILLMGCVGVYAAKSLYSVSAEQGWLGEKAREKYEKQTGGDKSLKALLLGGRMESFGGLIACVDKPIVGFGPWAVDKDGYTEEFLRRYANEDDYINYQQKVEYYANKGMRIQSLIPVHAYITEFWLWYGIAGLVFWLYVIYVLLRYIRQDCWAVPQWFMWVAAYVPAYFWSIFFNPWANRVNGVIFIVACLMARAVRLGKQPLPSEMIREIQEIEMKSV